MDFLAAELIASHRAVPALSDRVKAADFDGPHKKNRKTSNHERLLLRLRRQKQRDECGQREEDVEGVWCGSVCLCVRVKGENGRGGGGGERMIETSNQSHCREQRAGRGLMPVVTLLSAPVFRFFPLARGSIDEWSAAREVLAHTLTHLLNPLCDNLCHADVYRAGDERRENAKFTPLHRLRGRLRGLYFH